MTSVLRKIIAIKWQGKIYECFATPLLLERIKSNPAEVTFADLANSGRLIDVAWIFYCMLREAGAELLYEDAVEHVIANTSLVSKYVAAVIDEIVNPITATERAEIEKKSYPIPKTAITPILTCCHSIN